MNVQIEDAEEEKSSVHLKEVIKSSEEGVTTMGFGNDEGACTSAAVNMSHLSPQNMISVLYLSSVIIIAICLP